MTEGYVVSYDDRVGSGYIRVGSADAPVLEKSIGKRAATGQMVMFRKSAVKSEVPLTSGVKVEFKMKPATGSGSGVWREAREVRVVKDPTAPSETPAAESAAGEWLCDASDSWEQQQWDESSNSPW
jgi:hypothetical protein